MTPKLEKKFLIAGIIAGAFIAIFYDLFQELFNLIFPNQLVALIKTLSGLVTVLVILVVMYRYLKSLKSDDGCTQKTDMTNEQKKRFGKFATTEMITLFILLGAGTALTITPIFDEFLFRFGIGAVASGLFIWGILRRAKSKQEVQTQIDNLQQQIDDLRNDINKQKESRNDDNSKQD